MLEGLCFMCVCVCVCVCDLFSHVQLFATPWTIDLQAPLSTRYFRQEYWNGLPFPSEGDLPNPGIKPRSPALQADSLPSEPPGKPLVKCQSKSETPPAYFSQRSDPSLRSGHSLMRKGWNACQEEDEDSNQTESGLEDAWEACLGFISFLLICFWLCVQ